MFFLLFTTANAPFAPETMATACRDAPSIVTVPTYHVPAGTNVSYAHDTVIRAQEVVVQGALRMLGGQPGIAAPSLCIQTERMTLGPAASICTGDGQPGRIAAARTPVAGTDGAAGGDLEINVLDNPRTSKPAAIDIAVGAILCTGVGGDGGPGVVVPDCALLERADAKGGQGGDGGLLALTFAGKPSNLAIPPGALRIGNGGDGGLALALAENREAKAVGGDGGDSPGKFRGIPDAILAHAIGASEGGSGGFALASSRVACEPCQTRLVCETVCLPRDAACPVDLGDCLAKTEAKCPIGVGDGQVCQLVSEAACDMMERCRGNAARLDCPLVGADGWPKTSVGASGSSVGDRGTEGDHAKRSYGNGLTECTTTPSSAGGDGGDGDNGQYASATGGAGQDGWVRGGNGGVAEAWGGHGTAGGAGGLGGNGFVEEDSGVHCDAEPCSQGGAGGDGGDSSEGGANGGPGGDAVLGVGGNGGAATVHVGTPGSGGNGGNGGTTLGGTDACLGGCGGDGGDLEVMVPVGGMPGGGPRGQGTPGAEAGRVDEGQTAADGAAGTQFPGSC